MERGWEMKRVSVHLMTPHPAPLIGVPMAWSPGTKGTLHGKPVIATVTAETDIEKHRGKLRDKIVLVRPARTFLSGDVPLTHRLTDAELAAESKIQETDPLGMPLTIIRPPLPGVPPRTGIPDRAAARLLRKKIHRFFAAEGVALAIYAPTWGDSGTFTVQGDVMRRDEPMPPSIVLAAEHYNRLFRLVTRGVPAEIEAMVDVSFRDDVPLHNVVADLPGTEPNSEPVVIGAHIDSWHGGTGATDNAAGVAVAMEALRLLREAGARMRRTVRLILFTAEEHEHIGSKAYVSALTSKPCVMFNLDAGGGRIRGIYTEGLSAARPILQSWLEPVRDLGASTVSGRKNTSSDHEPFRDAGVPALNFITDPLDYPMRTWHTNMDVYDRLQPDDSRQASIVTSVVLFQAANLAACSDLGSVAKN